MIRTLIRWCIGVPIRVIGLLLMLPGFAIASLGGMIESL